MPPAFRRSRREDGGDFQSEEVDAEDSDHDGGEEGDAEDSDHDGGEEEPSHLPFAPPSETLDLPTTVDPSYVISLIRQLLPHNLMEAKDSAKINDCNSTYEEPNMCDVEDGPVMNYIGTTTPASEGSLENHVLNVNVIDESKPSVCNCFSVKPNCLVIIDQEVNGETRESTATEVTYIENNINSKTSDPWETAGCILWDLAASRTHAEFMVDNYLLEVLLATLHNPQSSRVTEISLGIIGNLACHESVCDMMASKIDLVKIVVSQLFLDDSTCLSELFRLFSVTLQGRTCSTWAKALLPDQHLLRTLWIVENTLNLTLLGKSIEFLTTIVDNPLVASMLLEPMVYLGLPNVLVSLLTCELCNFSQESNVERYPVLELILGLVEAISASDTHSQLICSNEDIFHLICSIIKLPEKNEVASSCASAVVIISNFLSDEQHLTLGVSQDYGFLEGLLDILPLVSDDSQAVNALWCIMDRVLLQIQQSEIDVMNQRRLVSLFLDKSCLIKEVMDCQSTGNEKYLNSPDKHSFSHTKTEVVSFPNFSFQSIFQISDFIVQFLKVGSRIYDSNIPVGITVIE